MKILMMMIVSIMLSATAAAQTFQDHLRQADALYSEKNYRASAEEFAKAFTLGEGTATHYYNAACSSALSGDSMQAIKYLSLSAGKGWKDLKQIQRDKDLLSLHTAAGWSDIVMNVRSNLDEYEKNFDKPLKARLEQIYYKDQTLRQLYKEAEEKFGKESDEMKYFWSVVSAQDGENEKDIADIIETHGWVGKSLVGGQANMTLWLVIQHAPIETQEKYLPLLRESVLNGESSGSHLALLEDRILMRNGKPQTYGSQIVREDASGKDVVYTIHEPEYVNQRRKAVGLGPIEDYLRRWGIEWTITQSER